jgi:peptidoglycan/LPS O-acetylase OafA/YrhL
MVPHDGLPPPRCNPSDGPEDPAALRPSRLDTSLMLCIACGLIVNSHLEQYWPRSMFAVDGLLGNSFFYLLSGFGIGSSLFSRPQRFLPYVARRLVRIYPAVIVTVSLCAGLVGVLAHWCGNSLSPWSFDVAFRQLAWPTPFTYVRNIIVIYVIGYIVAMPRSPRVLRVSLAMAIGVWAACSAYDCGTLSAGAKLNLGRVSTCIYDSFDTALFLGGMVLAATGCMPRRQVRTRGMMAGVLCIAYFALKYLMVAKGVGAGYYPLLFVIVGCVSWLSIGVLGDPRIIEPLRRVEWIGWIIDLVAGLTLEVYVVHQTLIGAFPALASIQFPLNIVLLLLISVAVAALLRMITAPLQAWVDRMTRPAVATPSDHRRAVTSA